MRYFNRFRMLIMPMALLAAVLIAGAGEGKPSKQFWYKVTIALPNSSEGRYEFVGKSSLNEAELARSLAKAEEYIKLDDCLYRDKGKYLSWHEWDATVEPRLYLNPRNIIVVQPLVGDPREVVPDAKK